MTREEAQTAAQTAAKVSGVQKVVTCFSIATREEIDHRMKDLQQAKPSDEKVERLSLKMKCPLEDVKG